MAPSYDGRGVICHPEGEKEIGLSKEDGIVLWNSQYALRNPAMTKTRHYRHPAVPELTSSVGDDRKTAPASEITPITLSVDPASLAIESPGLLTSSE